MNEEKNSPELSNDQIARRKLLTMAAYIPPAILGVMIAGNKIAEAGTTVPGSTKNCPGGSIVVSAGGTACCPCVPGPKYNANKCNEKRCKLGNCPACKKLVFTSSRKCNEKVAASGCACTCTETPAGSNFWLMTGC
ncbi:MAG: hypothetical protein ABUK11_02085 [Mariprofundaceae bacterium]